MSLADHVRILGRGPGRSRSLTQDEAAEAMGHMLRPDTAPEAVGALLMLLRMKGETAEEIAGFAAKARAPFDDLPGVDLDWPSYAAGRTRGTPWFLMSAKLVAQSGTRVLLHGWNGADDKVRQGLVDLEIGSASNADEAASLLDRDGIAYLPLETLHPSLFRLLGLRSVLGLRSCINTVCRMLNPADAGASVQGVFHPSYRLLQADAAQRLGWNSLSVIKGGGGEFEVNPSKDIAVFGLRRGQMWDRTQEARWAAPRRLAQADPMRLSGFKTLDDLPGFERSIVVGTAALAMETAGIGIGSEHSENSFARRHETHAA